MAKTSGTAFGGFTFRPFDKPSVETMTNNASRVPHSLVFKAPTSKWTGADLWGWDAEHVRMPCSPLNNNRPGFWDNFCSLFRNTIYKNGNALGDVIKSYNRKYERKWSFRGLEEFSRKEPGLFKRVVPEIICLATQLPYLIGQPIPILRTGREASVTLSQAQIASLLATAFLCAFPMRNEVGRSKLSSINFNELFAQTDASSLEKIKCIFHYFEKVSKNRANASGLVTFSRRVLGRAGAPAWATSTLPLLPLNVTSHGSIEFDGRGMLQVDFANKAVGGGVLGRGAVQEEIRFVLSPELIVSRLFVEELADNEALVITGTERFSAHSGYARSFRFVSDFDDRTPLDTDGRRQCSIVAIDAIPFRNAALQYRRDAVDRELAKAYVGFHVPGVDPSRLSPVATGNWGCGAFNGDPRLKALLQLMAASQAGRALHYFTYGDDALAAEFAAICNLLGEDRVNTVGALYTKLISIQHPSGNLFDDLRRAVKGSQNTARQPSGQPPDATPPFYPSVPTHDPYDKTPTTTTWHAAQATSNSYPRTGTPFWNTTTATSATQATSNSASYSQVAALAPFATNPYEATAPPLPPRNLGTSQAQYWPPISNGKSEYTSGPSNNVLPRMEHNNFQQSGDTLTRDDAKPRVAHIIGNFEDKKFASGTDDKGRGSGDESRGAKLARTVGVGNSPRNALAARDIVIVSKVEGVEANASSTGTGDNGGGLLDEAKSAKQARTGDVGDVQSSTKEKRKVKLTLTKANNSDGVNSCLNQNSVPEPERTKQ